MNILLINHYAGSPQMGMEYRPYYLAGEWVKTGHRVTVVGSSFSHLRIRQPEVSKDYERERIDGIDYIWLRGGAYRSAAGRISNILSFVSRLWLNAARIAREVQPDAVISSSTYPLDIYSARRIAQLARAKLIYEIHDLWPLSPMLIGGYPKRHPFVWVMQRAEDYCYRHADKVVSLLWNAREHIRERGFYDVPFACVPNGYLKAEWEGNGADLPERHSALFRRLKDEGRLIVGYAGGHAPSTALGTLIEAAGIVKTHRQIAFVLTGDGTDKKRLMEKARGMHLDNVHFLPPVNKACIPQLIRQFDMAYMGGTHSVLHKYGTSFNKMTDYMLAAKPILFSADEPCSLVERVGCGVRVEAENPKAVAEALLSLAGKTREQLKATGEKGRTYAVENLEYAILARKFVNEMENIGPQNAVK